LYLIITDQALWVGNWDRAFYIPRFGFKMYLWLFTTDGEVSGGALITSKRRLITRNYITVTVPALFQPAVRDNNVYGTIVTPSKDFRRKKGCITNIFNTQTKRFVWFMVVQNSRMFTWY
jgi:hypothetical protein